VIVAVVGTLAVALLLFAGLSIAAIDRTLHASLDSNLKTTAQAIAGTVDVNHGRPDPDTSDRAQMQKLRALARAAVLDAGGRLIDGDAPPSAADVRGDTRVEHVSIIRDGTKVGSVVVWSSNEWIDELDRDAILVSLFVGLLVLGAGALVAFRVADTIIAPLDRAAALVEGIEGRDLSLRIGPMGIAELARFSASFDRMFDRLEAAFSRERQFTADASHELRAPLAVLRAEAELALRRERTTQEYREAFEGVLRETVRLEALVDDLLAAARAEVDAADRRTTDVALVARDVVDRCRSAAAVKHVRLVMHGGAAEASVDAVGIERALLAIVHNAIAFAPPSGTVEIAVETAAKTTQLVVRDDGPGFSREALAHATQRFWRADGGRPRGGTGLGLAIAHAIVEANGGELLLSNGQSGGAEVSLRFRA
jgi:signal transduction histidine kinase